MRGVFILNNGLVVRLIDVPNPAEHQLAQNREGAEIVKLKRDHLSNLACDQKGLTARGV